MGLTEVQRFLLRAIKRKLRETRQAQAPGLRRLRFEFAKKLMADYAHTFWRGDRVVLQVYQDGDEFFVARLDFVDLQQSNVVWISADIVSSVERLIRHGGQCEVRL